MGTKLFPRGYFSLSSGSLLFMPDLYWNIIPGREIVPGAHVGFEARDVLGSHLWEFCFHWRGCLSIWSVLKVSDREKPRSSQSDPRILDSINHRSDPMQLRQMGAVYLLPLSWLLQLGYLL